MPRRRNDQQAPQAASGQAYGESTDQIQAQNIVALPNNRNTPPPSHSAPTGASAGSASPADAMAAAVAAATGTPPGSGAGLAAPSSRPGEPITSGLTGGPGPGPTNNPALSRAKAQSVADNFALIAQITGDPKYRTLALRAAQQGL